MRSACTYEILRRLVVALACITTGATPLGCGALVGATVGAGARSAENLYVTSRGATSIVNGSVKNVAVRTQKTLAEMHIPITETLSDGDHRRYKGVVNGVDVTVHLARTDSKTTSVQVDAQRGLVSWDKDLATTILMRIIETKA
jgi:hypothetical protein